MCLNEYKYAILISECANMNNDINWESLKFFIALCKTRRLQKAANLLKSNHTTVFRRVKAFEEELNTKLFESTPDGYNLTPAGEKLYEKAKLVEANMADISATITGLDQELVGEVKLSTTDSLGHTILPKVLGQLKKEYPGLKVNLSVSLTHHNLSKREADIALRPSSHAPPNLVGRRLGKISFAAYATKSYLKKNPISNFLKECDQHDILCLDDSLAHLAARQWLDKTIKDKANFTYYDNLMTTGQYCNEGLGIAFLPTYFELFFPKLQKVFTPKEFIGSDFWLLTHKDLKGAAKIKVTMEHLYQEVRQALHGHI